MTTSVCSIISECGAARSMGHRTETVLKIRWTTPSLASVCWNRSIRMAPSRRLPMSLVAACSLERGIGQAGNLPWSLPGDWSFFCTATRDQVLIVGRRSFAEFGVPLANRHTIVVSSSWTEDAASAPQSSLVAMASSLDQALELAASHPRYAHCQRAFVGGGQRLYEEALLHPQTDSCLLTRVHQSLPDADAFFPKWTHAFPRLTYSTTGLSNGCALAVGLIDALALTRDLTCGFTWFQYPLELPAVGAVSIEDFTSILCLVA